jgi:hypothetical protein
MAVIVSRLVVTPPELLQFLNQKFPLQWSQLATWLAGRWESLLSTCRFQSDFRREMNFGGWARYVFDKANVASFGDSIQLENLASLWIAVSSEATSICGFAFTGSWQTRRFATPWGLPEINSQTHNLCRLASAGLTWHLKFQSAGVVPGRPAPRAVWYSPLGMFFELWPSVYVEFKILKRQVVASKCKKGLRGEPLP